MRAVTARKIKRQFAVAHVRLARLRRESDMQRSKPSGPPVPPLNQPRRRRA